VNTFPSYQAVDNLLKQANAYLGAAELQGLLLGFSCCQDSLPQEWLSMILAQSEPTHQTALSDMINLLLAHGQSQLNTFGFELNLLLPDDDIPLNQRVDALAEWCQGYLMGLQITAKNYTPTLSEETKKALVDIKNIASLAPENDDSEQNEQAYQELSEFVKLTILTIFTEMNTKNKTAYH